MPRSCLCPVRPAKFCTHVYVENLVSHLGQHFVNNYLLLFTIATCMVTSATQTYEYQMYSARAPGWRLLITLKEPRLRTPSGYKLEATLLGVGGNRTARPCMRCPVDIVERAHPLYWQNDFRGRWLSFILRPEMYASQARPNGSLRVSPISTRREHTNIIVAPSISIKQPVFDRDVVTVLPKYPPSSDNPNQTSLPHAGASANSTVQSPAMLANS